ncbi:hypothetical protein TW95_gp0710 [Pandoravirus inopinatum]|uniref:Uncharacterized protein n=1 Tax=Pandoravirus inopinatum TaxID=1605721 RepID=A0A0B5J1P2_9VIRU|nr:hypothetical protein TW95_gp0710 [Pandoravirus inopinatum]AJF97444.1 hypothetical protein [Pandoravirus inopinatum]
MKPPFAIMTNKSFSTFAFYFFVFFCCLFFFALVALLAAVAPAILLVALAPHKQKKWSKLYIFPLPFSEMTQSRQKRGRILARPGLSATKYMRVFFGRQYACRSRASILAPCVAPSPSTPLACNLISRRACNARLFSPALNEWLEKGQTGGPLPS